MKLRNLSLSLLLCLGCVAPPTAQELGAADYGAIPSADLARRQAEELVLSELKHADTARLGFGELKESWFQVGSRPNRFAWLLPVSVHAKSGYGGYRDASWPVYFRGDRIVALGRQESYVSFGVQYYTRVVEMDGADGSLDGL